jgi:hypothetical protein
VLLVFAMAATIAISLYLELPRAAFEAQRDKEQLLIDRGEAYSRAVQLYVRKFNRFPPDFDALNNTQGIRFLRRQYSDPMTGKDEWRVVHVGPGGVFTDSLVHAAKKQDDKNAPQTFITELQSVAGNTAGGGEGVNLATRKRASDTPGAPGDPANPPQPGTGDPSAPVPPGTPVQVLPDGRIVPVVQGSQNGAVPGGTALPGQPGANPSVPAPAAPNPGFPQGFPGQQGNPGTPGQPNAPPAAAANLINQLLTTPRPGGLPGQPGAAAPAVDQFGNPLPQTGNGPFQPVPQAGGQTTAGLGTPVQAAAPQGQVIGGGIAGVASKRDQEGIKVYNGRTDYKEWEFVYDISKDKSRAGAGLPGAQPVQGQAPTTPAPVAAQPGTPQQPVQNTPTLPGFPGGVSPRIPPH